MGRADRWSTVVLGLSLTLGCRNAETFNCQDDAGCGDAGRCETNGFCSFPDAACASGRRYGELAGAGLQGQCVADDGGSTGTPTTGDAAETTTGCAPGTSLCACADGQCDAGLECVASVCVPSTDFGSSSGGTDETGGTGSSTDSSTSADASTSEATSDSEATGSTTTGGAEACNADRTPCHECFACASETTCVEQHGTCERLPECATVAQCLDACATQGLCLMNCCEGVSADVAAAATALHTCREDACLGASCPSFAAWECNP